ncbi:MAG: response regulator [Erythrobacter sp.]
MARILIADDDELIAEIASETLIDAGHASGWVTSGEKAWELLIRHKRPDLLLLDQDMPGISGISLLRKLRGSPKFYDLPIIMFTAMKGEEDENQAIFAGAQDFIRKPFDARILVTRVTRVLSNRVGRPKHTELQTVMAREAGMICDEPRSGWRFL